MDTQCHFFTLLRVLSKVRILEPFAKYLGQLACGGCRVCAKNKARISLKEVRDVLHVLLSFLLVVGERQQAEPVLNQVMLEFRHTHNISSLILYDLADRSDCVVACVVVLGLFDLLSLDLGGHSVLN